MLILVGDLEAHKNADTDIVCGVPVIICAFHMNCLACLVSSYYASRGGGKARFSCCTLQHN
jgi:hypothetical protein